MDFIDGVIKGLPVVAITAALIASLVVFVNFALDMYDRSKPAWHGAYVVVYLIALILMVSYIFGSGV